MSAYTLKYGPLPPALPPPDGGGGAGVSVGAGAGGALGGVDLDAVSADPEHAVVGSEAVADDGATGPDEDAGTREITLDSTEMLVHPGGRWEGGGTPALRLNFLISN